MMGVPSGPSDAIQGVRKLFLEISTVIPRTEGNFKMKLF